MSNLRAINHLKKQNKRVRVMVSLSKSAYESLLRLHAQEPDNSASQVVSDCIRFAEQLDIYKPIRQYIQDIQIDRGIKPMRDPLVPTKKPEEDQKDWCALYGGEFDGVNCSYKKYEVTAIGDIYESDMKLPLRQMPRDKDEFRKSIIGNFVTLADAVSNYENQKEKTALAPVKVLGKLKN